MYTVSTRLLIFIDLLVLCGSVVALSEDLDYREECIQSTPVG